MIFIKIDFCSEKLGRKLSSRFFDKKTVFLILPYYINFSRNEQKIEFTVFYTIFL